MATSKRKSTEPAEGTLAEVPDVQDYDLIRESMTIYGTEVNLNRSVPDIADGLKPVHRKLLVALHRVGGTSGKMLKAGRVVGECFAAGTGVLRPDGSETPIELMSLGDKVMTDTGVEEVTNLFTVPESELYEIVTEKGTVLATPDQVFYCLLEDGSEVGVQAKDLTPDHRIITV